ncbi:MAG: S24 family peptidase [Acidobacteriota bacterium]
MNTARTKRQRQVLDFITSYIENHGHQPSYQLIARKMGLASKAGIGKHIDALEAQGLLFRRRENGSFRLRLGNGAKADNSEGYLDWIGISDDGNEQDDIQTSPFAVPLALIGSDDVTGYAAFRVPDDSMLERHICEGDIALIDTKRRGRDGDCLVVTLNDGPSMLRNLYRDGSEVELRSANPSFDNIRLAGDELTIHGVCRALVRPRF